MNYLWNLYLEMLQTYMTMTLIVTSLFLSLYLFVGRLTALISWDLWTEEGNTDNMAFLFFPASYSGNHYDPTKSGALPLSGRDFYWDMTLGKFVKIRDTPNHLHSCLYVLSCVNNGYANKNFYVLSTMLLWPIKMILLNGAYMLGNVVILLFILFLKKFWSFLLRVWHKIVPPDEKLS